MESLREDLALPRHPADGAGRAWLDPAEPLPALTAGSRARFALRFEAGPLGIAVGGSLSLQVSPFWGWSPIQLFDPERPGYTSVASDADGVMLVPEVLDAHLLRIEIGGRALAAGEQVRIVYGDGPAGARVDRFAERGTALFLAVDGDGDGVRKLLPDPPRVDIAPGPPAALALHLPGSAQPGETVTLRIAVLDAESNGFVDASGSVELVVTDGEARVAKRVALEPGAEGTARVDVTVGATGIVRVSGSYEGLRAESNPLRVRSGAALLWADLHGHTQLSDGTGTPEDYFRYAREIAALDVAALTDHDHWGMPFLDASPANYARIRQAVADAHAPGAFVALLGFEWTHWVFGHRHVVYFADEGPLFSSLDAATDTPAGLWRALRGRPALTFAHHSAGDPVAIDWTIPPDPELEPVTEVVSVHGSSEASDSPLPIRGGLRGNYVRDALDRGYRLGLIGSGDSHDGHPGLAHRASGGVGGLAGIYAEGRTREAVRRALQQRRVYATSGPRILLETSLGDAPMGARIEAPAGPLALRLLAVGTAPIARVDVIRSGAVAGTLPGEGRREVAAETRIADLRPGEYVYVRVIQDDQGLAFSSPVFVE